MRYTRDEIPGRQKPPKTGRAERDFHRSMKGVAEHVGALIEGFPPGDYSILPTLTQILRAYADALTPWAKSVSSRMLAEVNGRDKDAWRSLGKAISQQLHKDIANAPVGGRMRELLGEQVTLIRSLPIEAAQRVHDLTLKGLEDSTRAAEFRKEILASGEVTGSRATLIARTEVSRTAAILSQARAEYVGSEGYIWETSEDGDVRPSHREMQGKFVRWDSPPTLDKMTGHAGCFPNCRCWARAVLPTNLR